MTEAQIKYILTQTGYDYSEDLDLARFSCIFLDNDSNLYPNPKTTRYHFDFTNKVLEVYDGKLKSGTFYYNLADRANHYISFNLIAGFIQNAKITPNGQFVSR